MSDSIRTKDRDAHPCNEVGNSAQLLLHAILLDGSWSELTRKQAAVHIRQAALPVDSTFLRDHIVMQLRQIMHNVDLPLSVRMSAASELLGLEETNRWFDEHEVR
jgi:hypothetical protein